MRRFPSLALYLTAGLLCSLQGLAQTPVGPEFRANEQGVLSQFNQNVAVARTGEILVVWESATPDAKRSGIWGQWFSPEGRPLGRNLAIRITGPQYFDPVLSPGEHGGVMVYWRETHDVGVWYDNLLAGELAVDGTWIQPPRVLTSLGQLRPRFIRPLPQGGYAISLIGTRPRHNESRTFLLVTDSEGVDRRPGLIYPAGHHGQYVGGLAMSPLGRFLLTWSDEGGSSRVLSQVFSPNGKPLGKPLQVHDDTRNAQYVGEAAPLGDQGYVVVWEDENYETGRIDLKMRFLAPDGSPRGPVLPVDEEKVTHFLGGDLAADAAGNFFVVWEAGGEPGSGIEVWGRLFHPDGTPFGPKRVLNSYHLNDQHDPTVAAGADGTFVVVWQSDEQDGDFQGVFGQVFATPSESSAVRR
jgi:hypothetical protein